VGRTPGALNLAAPLPILGRVRAPLPALRARLRLAALPSSALERLRLLFLAGGLIDGGIVLLAVPGLAGTSLPSRVALAVALVGLGAHWVRGYRRRRFARYADVPEAAALGAILTLFPGDPLLPLFGMLFRSLYGGPREAAFRALAYSGAVYLSAAGNAGRAVGLAVGAAVVQILVDALQRSERSEARLRSVVEDSSDVVTILGDDLRIRWQAPSVRAVLGHAPESLVGTPFLALVHPADAVQVEELLRTAPTGPNASATVEVRLLHTAGGERHVEIVAGDRRGDPRVEGWVLHIRDETRRFALERERRAFEEQRAQDERLHHELERLRERLDAQREHQQLEARLHRAQRLESVGQMAAGVAHDFNNLLAIILNYATFAREELPADAELQDDLHQIEQAARRGAQLTRQLLVFSQRRPTHTEVSDLNEVVGALDKLLARSLTTGIALRHDPQAGLRPVDVDVAQFEQVLVNLVVNARDAIGDAGTITVHTHDEDLDAGEALAHGVDPGRYVALSVTDDGRGMDPDTLARAPEPFFSTKGPGAGTGLGLATVFGLVGAAGGCVDLRSQLGVGTTVTLLLPAAEGVVAFREVAAEAADGLLRGAGERILVVEDERAVRVLVERVLGGAGYVVVAAACAEEALAVCALEAPFALVLSDVIMPGLSGHELAARLRAQRPEQRVLFMSGYSEAPGSAEEGRDDRVLAKPFSHGELRAAVAETLMPVPAA